MGNVFVVLVAEGVDYLFGLPSNPLFDTGAVEDAGIETTIVRQERTGVHMADAVSRVTPGDEVGVFACQHGPGTENAWTSSASTSGATVPSA
ncbi:thiamine pyrophosphate-binding protein [Halomicrococcus sp. SG-WS-1]|uniref:thiamine pyrophosphate-binding protein n=1 Tax=Halomicrococcus sp. SG-WS-1 TaxID=3439057 RepID=UPI003F7B29FC